MMMLSQAAEVLHGELLGNDILFTAVSKDTRSIKQGDLYVAIKGERFDGHAFVEQARQAGAVAALVQQQQAVELSQVCVDDTLDALGQLAANWRSRFTGKLIGLTGSNGKTTVKEMCRHVLQQVVAQDEVLATEGNLNNDIGMPMTLLKLREQHRYAVIEMGANHAHEIDYLTRIARPDVAIVNNAGPAHLQGFGSVENVASAKAEIFNGLGEQGVAVINLDDDFASMWLTVCKHRKVISFAYDNQQADVYTQQTGQGLLVHFGDASALLQLAVPGKHNVMNALAATAALLALDIELAVIAGALASFQNITGRLKIVQLGNGAQLIDDSYNANPASVKAGIDVLVTQTEHSVLVLGDMGELGDAAQQLHAEVGRYAKRAGVDRLLATGKTSAAAAEAFGDGAAFYAGRDELVRELRDSLTADTSVLVKGSRFMQMEKIVAALVDTFDA
jgi:UDP-N-acetylmuramoyl-tripeptide--D-alanyl-D-alanine ligase